MCQHRSMSRKYRMRETKESRVWQLDFGQIVTTILVDLSASVEMSTLVETSHAQFLSVLEELRVSCQVQRCPGLPMIQFPWKGEWLRSGVQERTCKARR